MEIAFCFVIFFLTLLKCGLISKNVLHLQQVYKSKNTILAVLLYISLSCFSGVMKNDWITNIAMSIFVLFYNYPNRVLIITLCKCLYFCIICFNDVC